MNDANGCKTSSHDNFVPAAQGLQTIRKAGFISMEKQVNKALVFKALGDDTRLQIVEMLSCGEMCACKILEYFHITQPTLSYHMKILTECGIVKGRKEGSWVIYSNNEEIIKEVKDYWIKISEPQEDCICRAIQN